MDDLADWHANNERYLGAALDWLRLGLHRAAQQVADESQDLGAPVTVDSVDQAAEGIVAASASEPQPALVLLSQRLGLTQFEQNILLLCAAMELDTRIGYLCALAQGHSQRAQPTFSLALSLFDDPAWDALSPQRPLRYWQLIDIKQPDGHPLIESALSADERITNFIRGINYLDDRLQHLLTLEKPAESDDVLPPSQKAIVETILLRLQPASDDVHPPAVQLLGPISESKLLVATQVARRLGLDLYHLPLDMLPTNIPDLQKLARFWHRESALLPIALFLDGLDFIDEEAQSAPIRALSYFLMRSNGVFLLDTRDIRTDLRRSSSAVDVTSPEPHEQQAAWQAVAGDIEPDTLKKLSVQFNLNLPTINEIGRYALAEQETSKEPTIDLLWAACLANTRPQLDTVAQRLEPIATWDDIVLPEDLRDLLRQMAAQVRRRGLVYEEWGFRRKMNRGLGITVLFAGDSGTGKTMAAEVLANELRLNLYRIDLSGVVSKYIGETEKNLRRLFDAAEDGGSILFFDEADALFGKRSQVKDSHDRYANIEVNYLLQRVEAYHGLAILTSNRKRDLDEAFIRRLRFVANFPVPEHEDRMRIWQQTFPPETPIGDIDYDRLAHFKLSGGSIHNCVLNAAFQAAEDGQNVNMPHLLKAVRTELLKSERLINESDFLWDA